MSDLYLVFSQPPPSVSASEYQRWYHDHLRENLETEGFDAGQRFALQHTVAGTDEALSHLAVYETRGSIDELRAALDTRRRAGEIVLPDWFGDIRFSSWHATELEERVVSRD
jgi:hypothetical protein